MQHVVVFLHTLVGSASRGAAAVIQFESTIRF